MRRGECPSIASVRHLRISIASRGREGPRKVLSASTAPPAELTWGVWRSMLALLIDCQQTALDNRCEIPPTSRLTAYLRAFRTVLLPIYHHSRSLVPRHACRRWHSTDGAGRIE